MRVSCLSYLLFSAIIIVNNILVLADDEYLHCKQSSCGENGISIRFPFRLRDIQPSNCGIPGFDLSCTPSNRMELELPLPLPKLSVRNIDYLSQEIHLYNPDPCLVVQLLQQIGNLSSSFFPFKYGYSKKNSSYTLLNCRGGIIIGAQPDCSTTMMLPSDHELQDLTSSYFYCVKLFDIESHPDDIYMAWRYTEEFITLTWSKPDCRGCEAKGKRCRLRKDAGAEPDCEIECFNASKSRKGVSKISTAIVATISVLIFCFLVVATSFYLHRLDKKDRENRLRIEKFLQDYTALKPSRCTYADIKKITSQFKDKLGQGAYGTVFKGKLSNDVLVAVKILNNTVENGGEDQFINEVATMGRIHHVNVVPLAGYCAEGFKRALVYEYLPNGSLDKYMSSAAGRGAGCPLSWEMLHDIALGIAKGIEYLHQGCDQRILHFDIKPHNILLDGNFIPKISDFGLAKLCSKDQSAVSITTARGTIGYIAPEVFSWNFGNVSHKSDVYSFGMLLLEMVGGRKNTNTSHEENMDEIYYPEWIFNLLEQRDDFQTLIEEEGDAKTARKLAIVGLWCIQWHPVSRPCMNVVVQMLEGNKQLSMPPNPFASTAQSKKNHRRLKALELEVIAE